MSFKKVNDNNGVACVTVYPKCIVWNLGNIPCLGIKTGDTLDEITFAITKKICEISQPLDLSTVSAQCLKDKLGIELPLNKTIATYLQLIIDSECILIDLIKGLQDQINGITNTSLVLNLGCLTPLDPSGNPLSYDVKSVLQLLINEACAIRNQITGLNGAIAAINIRIDNLPAPYAEPSLTTCLSGTPKSLSQTTTLLASDYCTYKINIGTISDIQTAIGRQCSGLNTLFAADANFIQAPTNLAHSENNQWITICNLLNRITALEACACKFTCDDIQIGFTTTFNDDKTVTLTFTTGAGTKIPVGFIDCGSILTIKNDDGVKTLPINVIVSQNGQTVDIDISMFESGEELTFDLNSKLCKDDIQCDKCTSKRVKNTSGCCLITNTGLEPVSIIYKTCGITKNV